MKVRLLFFAVLRDITGESESEISLHEGATAREVWHSLVARHPKLSGYTEPPMTAINETYASPDARLREGDELAFIPPVAGG